MLMEDKEGSFKAWGARCPGAGRDYTPAPQPKLLELLPEKAKPFSKVPLVCRLSWPVATGR
jgi:hypothetical protein